MKSMLPRCFFVPAVVLALFAATPLVRADDATPAKDKPAGKTGALSEKDLGAATGGINPQPLPPEQSRQ